jgi:hypothetical protein
MRHRTDSWIGVMAGLVRVSQLPSVSSKSGDAFHELITRVSWHGGPSRDGDYNMEHAVGVKTYGLDESRKEHDSIERFQLVPGQMQ